MLGHAPIHSRFYASGKIRMNMLKRLLGTGRRRMITFDATARADARAELEGHEMANS